MPYKNREDYLKNKKAYNQKHYSENKEIYHNKKNERKRKLIPILVELTNKIKLESGCVDCGYNHNPIALQFDHVVGKKHKSISRMISDCANLEKIKEEIKKCEVRCANCHTIIGSKRGSWRSGTPRGT